MKLTNSMQDKLNEERRARILEKLENSKDHPKKGMLRHEYDIPAPPKGEKAKQG